MKMEVWQMGDDRGPGQEVLLDHGFLIWNRVTGGDLPLPTSNSCAALLPEQPKIHQTALAQAASKKKKR